MIVAPSGRPAKVPVVGELPSLLMILNWLPTAGTKPPIRETLNVGELLRFTWALAVPF